MNTVHRDPALLRRLYTGESVQQARQAISRLEPGGSPIPAAASLAQVDLESRALLGLLEFRNVYTRYPLGITGVQPAPDGISLRVESEERAAEILFNLLPTYVADDEVHGVPGLRITRRDRTAIELRVLGHPTRLRLSGLPARLWRSAITRMLSKWIDPDPELLCWQSSPRSWTKPEASHRVRWDEATDHFVQVQQRGAWLGSGLLRRAALLHTVSNAFFLDGYRGGAFDVTRLVLRSSHVRGHGPGPHNIIAALVEPVLGLPLDLTRFRGDTDEEASGENQFVLRDSGRSVILDLRAATERPSSCLPPDVWQAILRRLPDSGFAGSSASSVLTQICALRLGRAVSDGHQ